MSACLFALNFVGGTHCSYGTARAGGREVDSLGEWWVGAVGWRVGFGSLESCCAGTKSTP